MIPVAYHIGAMGGKKLPYDAEVEYLETDGNEYFDSGIIYDPQIDSVIKMRIAFTGLGSAATAKYIFGYTGSNKLSINTYTNHYIFTYCGSNSSSSLGIAPTLFDQYDVEILSSQSKIDFNIGSYSKSYTSGLPSSGIGKGLIFGNYYRNGTAVDYQRSFSGRFFGVAINAAGSKVFDAFPVRFTNESGVSEGAMYDKVSGQLFRNVGTGAFVIGPDKVSSIGGGYKCLRHSSRFYWRSRRATRTSKRLEVAR